MIGMTGWLVAILLWVLGIVLSFAVIDTGVKAGKMEPLGPIAVSVAALGWPFFTLSVLVATLRKKPKREDDVSSQ